MGIFSDDEVNEAERLIEDELKRNEELRLRAINEREKKKIRLEFLESFEKGWKEAKKIYEGPGGAYQLNAGWLMQYLNADLNKNLKDFAYGFGFLVGIFRHHPILVLETSGWFIRYVNALKDKPEFYKFIVKRVNVWNKRIKAMFAKGEIWSRTEEMKRRYLEFIKSV